MKDWLVTLVSEDGAHQREVFIDSIPECLTSKTVAGMRAERQCNEEGRRTWKVVDLKELP
jgi:hypothetical protein